MTPTSSPRASDFAGPGDHIPMSAPARRLRALRDALRHSRLFRPPWHAGPSSIPPSPTPRSPLTTEDKSRASESAKS